MSARHTLRTSVAEPGDHYAIRRVGGQRTIGACVSRPESACHGDRFATDAVSAFRHGVFRAESQISDCSGSIQRTSRRSVLKSGARQEAEDHAIQRGKILGRMLKCSFCGRREDEVAKLVAGTGGHPSRRSVYICDRCIGKASDIVAKTDSSAAGTEPGPANDSAPWDDS